MEETVFFLMRHARTEWNLEKRIQGQGNSPLSPEGEEQAEKWAGMVELLMPDRIITSDLGRARQTAAPIASRLKIPVECDQGLREQDWGAWTGRTLKDLKTRAPEALAREIAAGWAFCPPGGESRLSVWERSRAALSLAAEKWPGQRLLVIAHQGVIKALAYRLSGRKFLPAEPELLKPYHLHELVHSGGGPILRRLNALNLC